MRIKKVLKFLFLVLLFTTIAGAVLFMLVFVPLLEQFNELRSSVSMGIESKDCLENFTMLFPIYTYQNKPFEVKHFDLSPESSENYSISIVDTEYGKMWEIKIKKLNGSGRIFFNHPSKVPLDLFEIKLKPVLNELVIKDEQKGRNYQKIVNLTIPLYIYYEGNVTELKISFDAYSGLDCFLGLIPVAPRHSGKVYAGHRWDEFLIDFKGWGSAMGISKTDITYQ